MFKNRRKFGLVTLSIFVLLLVTGCQASIEKDAKPGFRIYKVDHDKDTENKEADSK